MQPVLLGRSFAPLQGETGLCTAEMHSNHQTTRPPNDYCGGKDKGMNPPHRNASCRCCGEGAGELRVPTVPDCNFPIRIKSSSSSAISSSAHQRSNP